MQTETASPALGPSDVRVRIRAASLNYRDLLVRKGAQRALVPLSDGAGEVLEVGTTVTRVKVGDRVMANFFPHWGHGELNAEHHQKALGGNGLDGVLQEEVVLPDHAWVHLPTGYSFEEGATLPCAGLTAWHALFEGVGVVRPGAQVLLQGSGGVSIFALQLARSAGARVIMTTSSARKIDQLTSLGASEVIDTRSEPKWVERVHALTGNEGADLAVEVGGAGTFEQSATALRFGGALRVVGVLSGAQGQVNVHSIMYRRLAVQGIYVGSVPMFERFTRALSTLSVRPVIDRVYDTREIEAAYQHLASGAHVGKVVVRL